MRNKEKKWLRVFVVNNKRGGGDSRYVWYI